MCAIYFKYVAALKVVFYDAALWYNYSLSAICLQIKVNRDNVL